MANVLQPVYSTTFDSVSEVVVSHNQNLDNLGVQVVVDGDVRNDVIEKVVPSSEDPKNAFTLTLTSTLTGIIQLFAPGMAYVCQPKASEKAALVESVENPRPTVREVLETRRTTDVSKSGSSWSFVNDMSVVFTPEAGEQVLVLANLRAANSYAGLYNRVCFDIFHNNSGSYAAVNGGDRGMHWIEPGEADQDFPIAMSLMVEMPNAQETTIGLGWLVEGGSGYVKCNAESDAILQVVRFRNG